MVAQSNRQTHRHNRDKTGWKGNSIGLSRKSGVSVDFSQASMWTAVLIVQPPPVCARQSHLNNRPRNLKDDTLLITTILQR